MATTIPVKPYADNVTPLAAHDRAPAINNITQADLWDSLRLGWEDFKAVPSHAVMLVIIYPVLGLAAARVVMGYSILPLLFPIAAGFALVGPFAALGLYELSRRRELGQDASAWHALEVLRSPSFGAMLGLGVALMGIFVAWIFAAQAIYVSSFGNAPASEIPDFVNRVLTTPEGWRLILVGCGTGFLFAVAALCISVVSFPMMLDRHANVVDAVTTSLRAVVRNPISMSTWGVMVAALLIVGSIPLFLGLAVVIPLLGHSTWHLYRKMIERNPNPPPIPQASTGRRSAADFPVSLFVSNKKSNEDT